jgi:hypothetical protein
MLLMHYTFFLCSRNVLSWLEKHKPVISALQRQRQEDCINLSKFEWYHKTKKLERAGGRVEALRSRVLCLACS